MSKLTSSAFVDYLWLPLINLLLAFFISGLLVYFIGESPLDVLYVLVSGAFGSLESLGFTLYYATNFIFTGLAVAVAFRAGLFNIGGEGQLYFGGLGVILVCLWLDQVHWAIVMPVAILAALLFGGVWGFIPGYLQAKRGSHVVITTIMFNFIAAALMSYIIVDMLTPPGSANSESKTIDVASRIPSFYQIFLDYGIDIGRSPANISFLFALICLVAFWLFIWKTRWGYGLRIVGLNEHAANYGGINVAKNIIFAMAIGGGFAAFASINSIMGSDYRLIQNFTSGYGFIGIAVAFMGRNHPLGILLASLLFGGLYQGGTELDFEFQTINKDLIVIMQGLIILFCGALEHMLRPRVKLMFKRFPQAGRA